MVLAHELRIAAAQRGAIGVAAQPHRIERLALARGEADESFTLGAIVLRPLPDVRRPRADCVERIVEIGPARHAVDARVGAERAGVAAPPGYRRLRLEDLVRRHPLEPVVARVELAHVVEAEPAPV